ncbi:hypothetical protein LCFBJUUZ_CDS0085 [Staphylococcus phage PG-2021_76]|uniref:Uncharacterized protein n=1 Tax=Mammaliicoccus phage MSShimriz1 TaxID=3230127 RepID=A0AAU8GTK3_9VIRU
MTKRVKGNEINHVSDFGTGNDIRIRVGYGEVERDVFKVIIGLAVERLPEDYTVKEVNIDSDKRYVEVVGSPCKGLF